MRIPILVLAFGVALAAALSARAEILQGDRFITAMKDNTVSGRTTAGTAYNLYFLPGGAVTHSIVMRSKSGTVRQISAHHRFDRKPVYK
jgi:fructose-1,6-bisphosphatase/sedoheptulose 1,7-bisphosphatase-like protein